MSILAEVLKDLFKMFVADMRLTLAILALVAGVAWLGAYGAGDGVTGTVLALGPVAILILAVWRAARG